MFSVMFIPPAVALLFGEFVKVGAGGCTRPQLETLLLWPLRAGKAPGAQPGLNGTGRSWLPASKLQRAGLGRDKGTGSGGRRVGTCLRVSRGRERDTWEAEATQRNPGAPREGT